MAARKYVTIGEETMTEAAWAKRLGVTRAAIGYREKAFGETPEQAVSHFIGLVKTHPRIKELDTAWKVYDEWLKYVASDKDGVYKTFEQWLHHEYEEARSA